jgi:hypothetical protein
VSRRDRRRDAASLVSRMRGGRCANSPPDTMVTTSRAIVQRAELCPRQAHAVGYGIARIESRGIGGENVDYCKGKAKVPHPGAAMSPSRLVLKYPFTINDLYEEPS